MRSFLLTFQFTLLVLLTPLANAAQVNFDTNVLSSSNDVAVGIIRKAPFFASRKGLMKFIRAHDLMNVVAFVFLVVTGFAGPELADIQQQLCAIGFHELQIAACVIIIPGIVGYGQGDMSLK